MSKNGGVRSSRGLQSVKLTWNLEEGGPFKEASSWYMAAFSISLLVWQR